MNVYSLFLKKSKRKQIKKTLKHLFLYDAIQVAYVPFTTRKKLIVILQTVLFCIMIFAINCFMLYKYMLSLTISNYYCYLLNKLYII